MSENQLTTTDLRWITQAATVDGVVDQLLLDAMIARRVAGEPLQYVVGSWGFRSLDLFVDARVLIPRPETEQVVEAALQLIKPLPLIKRRPAPLVVDLGTGSGAIALSIATEVPGSTVYATDASPAALDVARTNAHRVGAEVEFHQGDWFHALPSDLRGRVDLIVSNPPYVAESKPEDVESVVHDWEPHSALYAGADGMDDIRAITAGAQEWLKPGGHMVIELAPDQAEAASELARINGFAKTSVGIDLNRRPRWLMATKRTGL